MQTQSCVRYTCVVLALCVSGVMSAAPKPARRVGMVDVPTAVAAWKVKLKKKETTATMEMRVRKDIIKLLNADLKTMDPDASYWRLLSYLRALPWESVTPVWRAWYFENQPNLRMTDEQHAAYLDVVKKKQIYQMTPKELDAYLGFAQKEVPDLRARVVHFARKNLGQPYKIYLLGEFPQEVYDDGPLFTLGKSDCVVFSEHSYAMALSRNWKEFFANLQHIRYKDGQIGMTTRNHYTEADWDKNNSWLVEDVTEKLGATTTTKYTEKIDRADFFSKLGIGQGIPVEMLHDSYIPASAVPSVLDKLQDGDFVNVARGQGDGVWIGHTGLIGHGKNGEVHFIHSTPPKVKEQPIMEYVNDNVKKNVKRAKKGEAVFLGFKFLRLRDQELQKKIAETPEPK
jgi:hypothetical protein